MDAKAEMERRAVKAAREVRKKKRQLRKNANEGEIR
jgi:hypothetical protein